MQIFRHGIKNQSQAQVGVIYLDFINMYLRNEFKSYPIYTHIHVSWFGQFTNINHEVSINCRINGHLTFKMYKFQT